MSQFILPDDLVTAASELPGDEPRVMSTKERQEAVLGKTAMEFDTEDQLKKYLDAHPGADRARHKVKAPGQEKGKPQEAPSSDQTKKPEEAPKDQPAAKPEAPASDPEALKVKPGDEKKKVPPAEVERFKQEIPEYKLTIVSGGGETEEPTEAEIKRAKAVFYQIKRGIAEAADVCKMSPPVCDQNLGIERRNMPQIPEDSIKKLLASDKESDRKLGQAAVDAGADKDDDRPMTEIFMDWLKKEGVTVTTGKKIPVGQLKATQREIQAGKTFGMADSYFSGKYDPTKKPIIVSSDGHILDGHHRWASMLTADPTAEMNVIQVNMPMAEILQKSFEMPGVFRADLKGNPVDASEPLDLARKQGSTWQQKGKWYAKNQEGKASGPFESKDSAEAHASGQKAKTEKKPAPQHTAPAAKKASMGDKMGRLEELRSKVAMEFPTEEALQKYLNEHPKANRANHSVKKAPEAAPKAKTKVDKDFDQSLKAFSKWYEGSDFDERDLDEKGSEALRRIQEISDPFFEGGDTEKIKAEFDSAFDTLKKSVRMPRMPKPKDAPKGKTPTPHKELKSAVTEMKKADHWDAVYSTAHDFDDTYGEYQGMFGDKKAGKLLEKAVGALPTEWPDGTSFGVDTHEEDPIVDIEEAIERGDDPDKIQGMIDAYPKLMKEIADATDSAIASMKDELDKAVEKGKKPKNKTVPGWKTASEDKMSRLEELRAKVASSKVAFKPASTEFVEWVLLKNDRLTAMECQKFLERQGLDLKEFTENKRGEFDTGETVRVNKNGNTNPLNTDVCEKWHDNVGTIHEVKPDHYVVQFPNNERVQFMGKEPGKGTGLFRWTPASVADKPGRQPIEFVYISDTSAPPPSKENLAMVQEYVDKGTAKGEKRFDIYYSGLPASMGISKEGMFYFKAFTGQRSSPIAGDFPRSFNPTKGKVLYLGILNRRPGGWESDLAKMRLQKGGEPAVAHTASETELRAAVVKMAHDVPEMRKHLIPILARTK